MKRHLETCREATEIALTALQACADTVEEAADVLRDLEDLSESMHASLASSSGWPEPSPEQTATLMDAVARLSSQLAHAALVFASLAEQVSNLPDL